MAAVALAQGSELEFIKTTDLGHVNVGTTSTWVASDEHQRFEIHFTKREDGLFDWNVARNEDGTGVSQPVSFRSVLTMKTKLQHAYAKKRLQNCVVKAVQAA